MTEPEIRAMRGTVPEVRSAAFAAIGALTRNDVTTAQEVLHTLVRQDSIAASMTADVLAEVVLTGLPCGDFGDLRFVLFTEFQRWVPGPRRVTAHAAADLATRVAMRTGSAQLGTHREMGESRALDVLLVLATAAAARVKRFVDLDSQAVEAYFAHRNRTAADRSGLGRHGGEW